MARRTLFEARLTQLRHQRWTKAEARLVLDALERSGDSVSAFARAHQLSAKKIFWWRNRSFDGLSNVVREILGRDPLSGHVVDENTSPRSAPTNLRRTSA